MQEMKQVGQGEISLALRTKQAAKALGISERLLWELTNRGEIPHVKVGRATLYPVEALKQWLLAEAARNAKGDSQ